MIAGLAGVGDAPWTLAAVGYPGQTNPVEERVGGKYSLPYTPGEHADVSHQRHLEAKGDDREISS
jgi:hypothetical protein